MFMGFILHIYIIFGTKLLTEGPARIAVFCLFQYFEGKEYPTESKRNETEGKEYPTESKRNETFGSDLFGTNLIQRAWGASQESSEGPTR